MHKNWKGNVKWLDLPMEAMHKLFRDEKRHDVLGSWGPDLSRVDDETGISRDVTDEEVLAYAKSFKNPEDPEIHLFNKFKTNQLIAKLMRGAIQLGHRVPHARESNGRRSADAFELLSIAIQTRVQGCRISTVFIGRQQHTSERFVHRSVRPMHGDWYQELSASASGVDD